MPLQGRMRWGSCTRGGRTGTGDRIGHFRSWHFSDLPKRPDDVGSWRDSVVKLDCWASLWSFERFVVWVFLSWDCSVGSCARGDARPGKSLPGMVGRDREAWRAV